MHTQKFIRRRTNHSGFIRRSSCSCASMRHRLRNSGTHTATSLRPGSKAEKLSHWEDKGGMEVSGVQSLGRQGWNGSIRSSVSGKTRLEWTEVSEGVQSLGRQGWNGQKCQEFSQWEDKAGQWEDKTGMNRSVRRSSVTGKTRLEWTEVSEGVQSSSKDRSS